MVTPLTLKESEDIDARWREINTAKQTREGRVRAKLVYYKCIDDILEERKYTVYGGNVIYIKVREKDKYMCFAKALETGYDFDTYGAIFCDTIHKED